MIFLALPNYGSIDPQTLMSVLRASNKHQIYVDAVTSSLILDGFNTLWANMLNLPDVSHFAMCHADVGAEPLWLDKMVKEMDDLHLDVISAVIPIKDDSGHSSTAMLQQTDQGDLVQRIALKDTLVLPQTFTGEDVEEELGIRGTLLVNTGLWVAKAGEWMKEFDGFRTESQIVFNEETQKYETKCNSEDWDFSLWAAEKGLKVAATTCVRLNHMGKKEWSSTEYAA